MTIVIETLTSEPLDRPARRLRRDEARLFELPPAPIMAAMGEPLIPLAVYSVPMKFIPAPFGRPQGIFEGETLRLEWQQMNARQPFYHRNADVDEISFQICGDRTLITECGSVDFKPGQFSRIPLGVAHDNYGREDVHLIFYLHGPAVAAIAPVAHGEHRVPPFPDWTARPQVETLTACLGGPHCALGYSMADETLILDAAATCDELLEVLEPSGPTGEVEWIYRAPQVWLGHMLMEPTRERRYRRHIAADEIQFQVEGTRTVVSQRGVVTLVPGEFVVIPRGCAFASVTEERSRHLSILTVQTVPAARAPIRHAETDVPGWLAAHAYDGDAAAPAVEAVH